MLAVCCNGVCNGEIARYNSKIYHRLASVCDNTFYTQIKHVPLREMGANKILFVFVSG